MNEYGIEGQLAPAWQVAEWFNLPDDKTQLERTDFAGRVLYLYCFQSWCPGCHSHGFPTLKAVHDHFKDNPDVAFVAIQTVFEGFDTNTLEAAHQTATRHDLAIPFGHDAPNGQRSNVMQAYQTGGTPWIILIDPQGIVQFNGFQAQSKNLIQGINLLLAESALETR